MNIPKGKKEKRKKEMKKFNLENIKEWKYTSPTTGGVRYLIIDSKNKILSTDYYLYNGGHRKCKIVQLKELKRLENHFINQGYKEV